MGTRYDIELTCSKCGHIQDAWYAPTCGFTEHKCRKCGHVTDLGEYTGISYEDASNLGEMQDIADGMGEIDD